MKTKLAQLIIMAIPIVLFGWLVVVDIVPSGEMVVRYEVGDVSPFVDSLLPAERVEAVAENEDGEKFVRIIDEPVYFSVNLPKAVFETLEVEVEFTNLEQPIFEIGALRDIFSSSYDLRPLHNLLIENSAWQLLEDHGVILLDRTGEIRSIASFFENFPERSRVASYHLNLVDPFRIADYQPRVSEQRISVSMRGYHQFITYLKDETFAIDISFSDMNRTFGSDEVSLRLRNELGDIMLERRLGDDGNTSEDQEPSSRSIQAEIKGLPEGVYKVELSGTSDIFWREIKTPQRYVTFINKIYLADQVGYGDAPVPVELYTNAKNLVLETTHFESTQTVIFGQDKVSVLRTHEKTPFTVHDSGVVKGLVPLGDLKITGDGKFAFSEDAFFDPDLVKLNAFSDLDALGIDYILTSYRAPSLKGNWLVNSTVFDYDDLAKDEGATRFVVSVPRIKELESSVDIHAITLTFKKEPLTFKNFLRQVRDLLPFGL